jgi:hypothetical protein
LLKYLLALFLARKADSKGISMSSPLSLVIFDCVFPLHVLGFQRCSSTLMPYCQLLPFPPSGCRLAVCVSFNQGHAVFPIEPSFTLLIILRQLPFYVARVGEANRAPQPIYPKTPSFQQMFLKRITI